MRDIIRRGRIADIAILLALITTAFWLTQWAYRPLRTAAFTMDALSVMLPRNGLHERERFPDGTRVYRWTEGHGRVSLPNPGGPAVVDLVLASGPRPAVDIQVLADNNVYPFRAHPGLRSYTLLVPAAAGERVALTINSPVFEERDRTLGVIVSNIRITGGGAAPGNVSLALAFATAGVYLLLRRAGLNMLPAAGILLLGQGLVLVWQVTGGWRYALFGPLLVLTGVASLAAIVLERWLPRTVVSPDPSVAWTRQDGQMIALLGIVALIVRLPWLGAPDPVGDLELAARRMWFLHDYGLAGSYLYGGDYMPFRLYLLWGLSQLVRPLGGDFFDPLPFPTLVLIKLPGLVADLATVAIIYAWSRRWCTRRQSAMIAALYTLSPPVWMNVAWWGQVDALLMLPLLGTVVLLDRAQGRWSWLCWTAALLIKPQAIILAPLLYMATLRLHGSRGVLQGGALAAGLCVIACTPLALAQQGPGLLEAYLGSVGRFPRLTIGAYNLWYLVTLGAGGDDSAHILGPLSLRLAGMLLMGGAALLVCIALLRRADGLIRAQGAAVLALAFFLLPTQIHERYLFLTLAFLALCIAGDERMVLPYSVLMLTATLNILGTLDGFVPLVHALISTSPLPLVIAASNLLVFVFLAGRLLVASRPGVWATGALRSGSNVQIHSGDATEIQKT